MLNKADDTHEIYNNTERVDAIVAKPKIDVQNNLLKDLVAKVDAVISLSKINQNNFNKSQNYNNNSKQNWNHDRSRSKSPRGKGPGERILCKYHATYKKNAYRCEASKVKCSWIVKDDDKVNEYKRQKN